jgi:hypothetical protein
MKTYKDLDPLTNRFCHYLGCLIGFIKEEEFCTKVSFKKNLGNT